MSDIIELKTNEISEYNQTAAALANLRTKYQNVIFPVETTKGMKDAVAARKELRELRVNLEKLRKEIKEPALRRCQMIDSEAKEITAYLTALEDPIDAQIKTEERRKEAEKAERERVERERVERIRASINQINGLALASANDSAADIEATIADLTALEIDDGYAEFKGEAMAAKEAMLLALGALYTTVNAREQESARLKAEREELDRQRAELERERAELNAAKADVVPRTETAPEPEFQLQVQEETKLEPVAETGGDIINELSAYTSMQFFALADKVEAIGYQQYAEGLRADGNAIAEGRFNEYLKTADWKAIADSDKRMALAAHACVSVLEGDADLGASALRQFNRQQAA